MTHLPEGWDADYDGTRWFYRYKATGQTQYHFPRSGDEFPELVGLGFEPLDHKPENRLTGGHQDGQKSRHSGQDYNGQVKVAPTDEGVHMGATGYFDPDHFLYFGLNDVSPVGNDNNTPVSNETVLAELPEKSEQMRSPVGFVAELASSDTARCAEELAPIELDAMQIAPVSLQISIRQNGPTELPTSRSPKEAKQSIQQPTSENSQPVEEYPLVSASFAYPPPKTAAQPIGNSVQGTDSQQPAETEADQNKYETWKPPQGIVNEELRDSHRKSMALSSISVLQSQNSELGRLEQKRHSLSGPIESSEVTVDLPDSLRRPSDPRRLATTSSPLSEVEPEPVPAILQPAAAPSKLDSPQDSSQRHSSQNAITPLPGSGARHDSISFSPGLSITDSIPSQTPSALKPPQNPRPAGQHPIQTYADNVLPGAQRVSTLLDPSLSHTSSLPKINGPGIYVFQEIPAAPGPTIEHIQNKPQTHVTAQSGSNNQNVSSPKPFQDTVPFNSVPNEPLPVIAPLSISKPQTPTSPNQSPTNSGTSGVSGPHNYQSSSVNIIENDIYTVVSKLSAHNGPHAEIGQPQGHSELLAASAYPAHGANDYQPQANFSTISQQQTSGSPKPQQKLPRKPVLPKRPDETSSQYHHSPQQGTSSSMESIISNSGSQGQPHPALPQTSSVTSTGQQTLVYNQQISSISIPLQHSQVSQHPQCQPPMTNTPNSPVSVQGSNHSLAMSIQASGQVSLSGPTLNQPITPQAAMSNLQSAVQRPPSNHSQRPPNSQPPNHNTTVTAEPNKPQPPLSPSAYPVSPLHSQVSSPSPSIASLHRPPSSASSHAHASAQGVIGHNRPPTATAHPSSPHVLRPTGQQVFHTQGNVQVSQSSNSPGNGTSKPFPMLPGQIKPMPSQLGSPPISVPIQPHHIASTQVQYPQSQPVPMKPAQQQLGNQQPSLVAVHKPPQQHHVQGHQMPILGSSKPEQPVPGIMQYGQPQPPVAAQHHTPVNSPQTMQTQGLYTHQNMGQTSQTPNGQHTTTLMHGAHVQSQISQTVQHPNVVNPSATQSFHTSQSIGQGQVQGQGQQPQSSTQAGGFQSSLSQTSGQIKPFNSAQAASALTDAGKKMKKWARKTWQNPTIKQATAVVGGVVFAESLGGDGVAGAALANRIYTNSQGTTQGGQPQRPSGLQHAHTAPPQAQNLVGTNATSQNATSQYVQPMNRPQLQQNMQPVGVQTLGRPPASQNPGAMGAAVNNNQSQSQMGVMNQQAPYQVLRPPVGRPPLPQAQQSATFSQPNYQAVPNQQVPQVRPNQPLYQMQPNQPAYQVPPGQHPYQAQGGTDPYAAIGSTLGGALSALMGGGDSSGASASSQQHHTTNPETQHESYSSQHHAYQSEQYHEPHSKPQHESYSEPHHEGQFEQHHAGHSEQQQESYSEQQNTSYSEPPPGDNQTVVDNSASYYAPQFDTTIINNTTINNVDNTAIAQSAQVNDTTYTDNTNIVNTTNMDTETTAFADTSYMDMSNTNAQASAFTDTNTNYTDVSYMDTANANTDMSSFTDTTYVDASYTDQSYMNATYDTTTVVDVNVDVSMDMTTNMNEATYMGDQTSMMTMDESMSVDASYTETTTADYSGGDWGGGEW
ncbi:hypothetical protein F4804DRAFT_324848 [Jackrogersella minutella]|nr:hypothetical protein F4804DRAFT_324848 [Jackrogersella minutella]